MDTYEEVKRPDLLALCRDRGLSGAGTNDELIARLRTWDTAQHEDDDPLGPDDEPEAAEASAEPVVEPTPEPPAETPPADGLTSLPPAGGPDPEPEPAPPVDGSPRVYRHEHEIGDWSLTDDRHFELIARTRAAAREAGHDPKGGETIGTRVRYGTNAAGVRTVTYEVPLRRRR